MAKILVVDDDVISRQILADIVLGEGHAVVEAANGVEALERFEADSPELVITDIFMPEKEGLETIKELKRSHPGLKIIAMTGGSAFTSYESLTWAKSCGAAETLAKPFDRNEVILVLRKLLS